MIPLTILASEASGWFDLSGISIERPYWLLAFIAVGIIMAFISRTFGVMSSLRRWASAILRLALILIIGACVAGVGFVRTTDKFAVVAVVDSSESVRRFGSLSGTDFSKKIQSFLERAASERGPDDLLGLVVFDGNAVATLAPTSARLNSFPLEPPGAEGTDIAGALRLARAIVPPDAAPRLVLLSDGNQTRGDADKAARELSSGPRATPIDAIPLAYKLSNEVFVSAVDAPSEAPAETSVRLRVTLFSTAKADGRLRVLSADGREQSLASQLVSLTPGENIRTIEVPLGAGRVHRFRAVFEPATDESGRPIADTLAENNSATAFTLTPGAGSVLIVEGSSEGAVSPLARTLEEEGLKVETLPARLVPADPLTLQGYDLVILENVGAEDLPENTQRLLAAGVRDMGLGLVMVGGNNSFGAGGWRNTPIEPLLPVVLDLPERLVEPEAAVIFVLDNSGSMRRSVMGSSRSQQEIANQSAAMALGALDRRDLVGVIAFNSGYSIIQQLSPNKDPASTASAILSIGPGGGTNLAPPLVEAGNQLSAAKAKNKHVIVLSDGVSQDKERLPEIARAMAARDIHVSCIAIGDDADASGMEEISASGGGKFYQVTNPSVLPKVFMRAMKVLRSPLVREEPFDPVILASGSPATVGMTTPPPLLGLSLTQPRPDPQVINAIVTPQGEPVLSHWRVELGQVAAFTSDAGRWAERWIDWPGYRRMWAQLARTIGRSQIHSAFTARTEIVGDELVVRVEAGNLDQSAGRISLPATVFAPSGSQMPLTLAETGPGVFEARAPVAEEGAYIAVIRPVRATANAASGGGDRLAPLITGASRFAGREMRDLSSNDTWLADLAAHSSGRIRSLDEAGRLGLFDRAGIRPVEANTPLWPRLLAWLPIFFLLDVGVRRIAWDRWLTGRLPQAAEGSSAAASELIRRSRSESPTDAVPAYQGMQLSEADAARLAVEARDRRRAQRLDSFVNPKPESAVPPEPGADSLLAAKRRARERFDDAG